MKTFFFCQILGDMSVFCEVIFVRNNVLIAVGSFTHVGSHYKYPGIEFFTRIVKVFFLQNFQKEFLDKILCSFFLFIQHLKEIPHQFRTIPSVELRDCRVGVMRDNVAHQFLIAEFGNGSK